MRAHDFDMATGLADMKLAAGKRLRRTRQALGFRTIRQFAAATGIDESRLSKWEQGEALVPPWFVERLRLSHKVTHDWIYGGDTYHLPAGLAAEIAKVGNGNHDTDD